MPSSIYKEVTMAERRFFASYEQGSGTTKLKLTLQTHGPVPIDEIKQELMSVSIKHSLPPVGGLFDVAMAAVGGFDSYQLGGMYIQLEKENDVTSELIELGYIIEHA